MIRKNEPARRKSKKDPNIYPPGWDYRRVQKIIKYYDGMKNEAVLMPSSVSKVHQMVWMEIPKNLVPKVQKLIAGMKKSA